jgi:CubicO group peptidase (beta-lactamase class C family)
VPATLLAAWFVFRPDRAVRVGTGLISHTLCSSVFVSGLDPDQVYAEALQPTLGMGRLASAIRYTVDTTRGEVRATILGVFASRAVYRAGRGCTLVAADGSVDDALSERGPGDNPPLASAALPPIAGPTPVDPTNDRWRAVLDHAFSEPDPAPRRRTKAVVVVHDGRVLAERYAPGYGVDTPLMGWSMAKSFTSALIGILVRQGRLRIEEAAPVPAWRDPADPRHAITIDHLLRMTSGLALDDTQSGFDSVTQMLFGEPDMAGLAERARLEAEPGRRWKYTSGNTLILSRIIRDAVGGHAADVLRFAKGELLGPLGISTATLEFDLTGTPVGSSFMLASARDWARFGMLYLDDGVVGGRRILPEGWVRYSSTQTLDSPYAAGFWRGAREWRAGWPIPSDAFFASGFLGQRVFIAPSARLVIVRFGATQGDEEGLGRLVEDALAALPSP